MARSETDTLTVSRGAFRDALRGNTLDPDDLFDTMLPGPGPEQDLELVRGQARRYLEARFGQEVWFRAPETFGNVTERWIWAVASAEPALAEECITAIEQHLARPGG
jgi:hypothetical protein